MLLAGHDLSVNQNKSVVLLVSCISLIFQVLSVGRHMHLAYTGDSTSVTLVAMTYVLC